MRKARYGLLIKIFSAIPSIFIVSLKDQIGAVFLDE
jgi:hypothetical protein